MIDVEYSIPDIAAMAIKAFEFITDSSTESDIPHQSLMPVLEAFVLHEHEHPLKSSKQASISKYKQQCNLQQLSLMGTLRHKHYLSFSFISNIMGVSLGKVRKCLVEPKELTASAALLKSIGGS